MFPRPTKIAFFPRNSRPLSWTADWLVHWLELADRVWFEKSLAKPWTLSSKRCMLGNQDKVHVMSWWTYRLRSERERSKFYCAGFWRKINRLSLSFTHEIKVSFPFNVDLPIWMVYKWLEFKKWRNFINIPEAVISCGSSTVWPLYKRSFVLNRSSFFPAQK